MTPYLLVDGARVVPEHVDKPRWRFRLRLPAREIRLISGSARPADLEDSSDRRQLGVLLHGLRWTQDDATIEVPIDSPSFIDGFHYAEPRERLGPVRWTTGDAALPPAVFPPWQGEVRLQLSLGEWRGSTHDAAARAEASLLGGFENLGEDCEFGLAQRHYLAEPPLSLLRWTGITADKLVLGLDSGFAGLCEPDSTDLLWSGQEYFLRTPFFTMHTNCMVEQDAAGAAAILGHGRATLRILRRKLLKDIADAARIFVFKSASDLRGIRMRRLHAALRRVGPASLLWVRIAPPGRAGGGAERLGDGLYVGYLDRFVVPHGPFDQWLAVCAETMTLHKRG